MSKDVDQKDANSAVAYEPVDQAMKMTMGKVRDVTHITLEGDESALMRNVGTRDPNFLYGLIHQVGNAGSKGQYPDERGIKFMLAFIKAREPRDEIDAALLAQMAATQLAVMRAANRLAHAESLQEHDSAERAFNKLTRTFVALVEARQRYLAISKQNVTVQLVSVAEGGQAIVGNVTPPADERSLTRRVPMEPALPDGQQAPMEIIGEPQGAPVPRRRQKDDDQLSA